ncbi:hypothetical protein Trydic_g19552 [Trypoxylus dichotomus]
MNARCGESETNERGETAGVRRYPLPPPPQPAIEGRGEGGWRAGERQAHSPRFASTTSFEFLISKPPCNYWINVNYDDALCSLRWYNGSARANVRRDVEGVGERGIRNEGRRRRRRRTVEGSGDGIIKIR